MMTLTALTLFCFDPHYLQPEAARGISAVFSVPPFGSNPSTVYKCLFNKVLKAGVMQRETI